MKITHSGVCATFAVVALLTIPAMLQAGPGDAPDAGTEVTKPARLPGGVFERQREPAPPALPPVITERQPDPAPPALPPGVTELSTELTVSAHLVTSLPLFTTTAPVIAWRLTNPTHKRSTGLLKVTVDGRAVAVHHDTPPPIDLDPTVMTDGQFTLPPLSEGTHTINVGYSRNTGEVLNASDRAGRPIAVPKYADAGAFALELTSLVEPVDADHDGLDDHEEHRLLQTYRPYFKFSTDGAQEHYNPADVLWYITQSELLPGGDESDAAILSNATLAANPFALLSAHVQNHGRFCTQSPSGAWTCDSDLTKNPRQTEYAVNPLESVGNQGGDPGRHGDPDWSDIKTKGNVGLYGHVVPDNAQHLIKIEYWQFFGYNNANQPASIADHEGDWTTVQLLFDPNTKKIVAVTMYAHGYEMRFDLGDIQPIQINDNGGLSVAEYRGAGYDISNINMRHLPTGPARMQQNLLRIYTGPNGNEFHPVVYSEYGAHEFWPSEHWVFIEVIGGIDYYAPSHNGRSYSYLTATPPNLGEVEHPLAETPAASIILRYNGRWGAFSKRNGTPQGPPLHNQWLWPADSSIRWQLPQDLGN
jgi:hypothetical protein